MSEQHIADQWVRRCAERLQRRHRVEPDVASELAAEALATVGEQGCPERAADELLRMPMEM